MTYTIPITPTQTPNMVIVKFNDSLISFPMAENGTLFSGEEFHSDYEMENYHVILARYDPFEHTSMELYRFSLLKNENGEEANVQDLYEAGLLQQFVTELMDNRDDLPTDNPE
jgi:hypothetical protein